MRTAPPAPARQVATTPAATATASVDPRESASSFTSLPPEVQSELRLGWRENDARDERVRRLSDADRKRGILEAVALVSFTEMCLYGFAWMHLVAAVALGVLIGETWWRCRAGQVATPAIAALATITLQSCWILSGHASLVTLGCSCGFIGSVSAYLGLRREMRPAE